MEQAGLEGAELVSGTTTIADGNTITRCNLRNCAVTSSSVKLSDFSDCVFSHARSVKQSTGTKTHFHDVSHASRSTFSNSIIRDQSSVHRSEVKMSTLNDSSNVKRSAVIGSSISRTSVSRTTLTDCNTEECIFERCSFKDMILKNGYWKRNQLIKKVGSKEPVAVKKDGPGPANSGDMLSSSKIPVVPDTSSKSEMSASRNVLHRLDSNVTLESEESDDSEDLPPPYKV
ncbi:hypothetical protein PEBR_31564 [Penicillium brasilianum]|uniref:Uncharacterized protein n=1 Tax=Penicillium brasilianum TaxID=104259 RepID=A0A1S9RF69_PENBI|nr:hypothetical protein PEBR_31564 [Penicillium brasilianum]